MNNQFDLVVTNVMTKNYTYAARAQARRILQNFQYAGITRAAFVIVGDASVEVCRIVEFYRELFGSEFPVIQKVMNIPTDLNENYKDKAQQIIARGRTIAFTEALRFSPKWCWSLDSDVLPHTSNLQCMLDLLRFDHGYYDVAMATYPNDTFLGGYGDYTHVIKPNVYPDERATSSKFKAVYAECKRRLDQHGVPYKDLKAYFASDSSIPETTGGQLDQLVKLGILTHEQIAKWKEKELKRWERLNKMLENFPPAGNVFQLNAKGFRQRGWSDYAHPGVGKGWIAPTGWIGFGNNLFSKRALELINFDGYDFQGTEDIFVIRNCFYQNNVRMTVCYHSVSDHVIARRKKKDSKEKDEFYMIQAYFEPNGECEGHLRTKKVTWDPLIKNV